MNSQNQAVSLFVLLGVAVAIDGLAVEPQALNRSQSLRPRPVALSRTAPSGLKGDRPGLGGGFRQVDLLESSNSSRTLVAAAFAESQQQPPYGISIRTPMTTSRFTGSPDPPPPYQAQRLFPKVNFSSPTLITSAPGTNRLFVAERDGKIYSLANDQQVGKPDLFLDLNQLLEDRPQDASVAGLSSVYGMTFHPQFAQNRFCYVCYVVRGKDGGEQLANGTRVSRFRVSSTQPPRCDPQSEKIIITWLQGGHNGGCLKFGRDGYLYISTGDGGVAFPPDGLKSGQDVSNLLSSILRIDVNHTEQDLPYAVPSDNPFVSLDGARPEIWAYGLRNPWKMSFDRRNGDLWVGDVGWELWEMVFRVRPGDNYGWSIVEGRQSVHPERKRGPTPIVPPTVEIPHTDGASITGGFVYRGKKFPELIGTYIFGDWETRRIWGVPIVGEKLGVRRDLVEPTVRIVGFAEDDQGELYLLDHDDGTIHQLVRNASHSQNREFPRRLSETGLFKSVAAHELAPGVLPFSINAEQWADNSTAQRFVAIPGEESIALHAKPTRIAGSMFRRTMDFPKDSVVAKTISLEIEVGRPESRRRIETQVLHFDGRYWRGYSYQWNDEQTDAALVKAAGAEHSISVIDPEVPTGRRTQSWRFSSRRECTRCHNPWAEHTLAFNLRQLNKSHDYGEITDNQLRTLKHIGLLVDANSESEETAEPQIPEQLERLTDPNSETAGLSERARSYLHVNCAHCHRFNGGGVAYIQLQQEHSLAEMKALDARPSQGTFEIRDAQILAPGDPYRSVLYYRISKLGSGRMPHIGSNIVDERGTQLVFDWIRQLPIRSRELAMIDQLISFDEQAALAGAEKRAVRTARRLAQQIAEDNKRKTPNDEDRRQAEVQTQQSADERAEKRAKQRNEIIDELLSSTSRALLLTREIKRLPEHTQTQVIAIATKRSEVQIRDLFEQFLPEEKRSKRLGDVIHPEELLSLTGDIGRGRELFLNTAGVQCKNCHRIGQIGIPLGPELTQIGKKNDRAKLLDSILEPSKNIDPKFVTYLVETSQGLVHTGLLVERSATEVVLKDTKNKLIRIPIDQVELLLTQRKSLMPELLLRDMTAVQVADLLAYLESLK